MSSFNSSSLYGGGSSWRTGSSRSYGGSSSSIARAPSTSSYMPSTSSPSSHNRSQSFRERSSYAPSSYSSTSSSNLGSLSHRARSMGNLSQYPLTTSSSRIGSSSGLSSYGTSNTYSSDYQPSWRSGGTRSSNTSTTTPLSRLVSSYTPKSTISSNRIRPASSYTSLSPLAPSLSSTYNSGTTSASNGSATSANASANYSNRFSSASRTLTPSNLRRWTSKSVVADPETEKDYKKMFEELSELYEDLKVDSKVRESEWKKEERTNHSKIATIDDNVKKLEKLRDEHSKLKAENTALVRVIHKLAK